MKIKAFNLTEMLIVLTIIGTISTLSLTVVKKSKDDYRGLYYSAYNTLVQAAGNAALNWNPTCSCPDFENMSNELTAETCWAQACWDNFEYHIGSSGNSVNLGVRRDYPGYLMGTFSRGTFDGYGTDKYFCEQLTSRLNTINESVECQYFITGYAERNKQGVDLDWSSGINFLKAFCNKRALTPDDYTQDATTTCQYEIQPTFITSNGQRFYVSKLLSTNANTTAFLDMQGEQKINREFFRLVAVDLNGEAGPNTQLTWASGKLPDIVLFALRSDGTVVPLGLPEFNRQYAGAVVQYPETLKRFDEDGNIIRNDIKESGAMALFNAKPQAWGLHAGSGIDVNTGTAYSQIFSEMEPLSYSSLLYQMATLCRPEEVGGSTPEGAVCPTERYTDELLALLISQFTFKKEGSNERIIISPESPNADTSRGCSARYSRCGVQIIPVKN